MTTLSAKARTVRSDWPPLALTLGVLLVPVAAIVCAGLVADQLDPPDARQHLALAVFRLLALLALVAGATVTAAGPLVALMSRRLPTVLGWFLDVGVRLGMVVVAVVVLLNGLLGAGIAYSVEHLVFGRTFYGSVAVLVFGAIASSLYFGSAALRAARYQEPVLAAYAVADDDPGLRDLVGQLAARLRVSAPDHVVVGAGLDFWATRGDVQAAGSRLSGLVVHVPLFGLARLSESQVRALVAFELAHFRSADATTRRRVSVAFARLLGVLEALDSEADDWARLLAAPGTLWVRYVVGALSSAVVEMQAEEGRAAFALAADAVGSDALMDALEALDSAAHDGAGWERALEVAAGGGSVAALEQAAVGTPPSGEGGADVQATSALVALVTESRLALERLVEARRAVEARSRVEVFNAPRLTPAIVLVALFGGMMLLVLARDGLWMGTALSVAACISFAVLYPGLQREVTLSFSGIGVRTWWRCIVGGSRRHFPRSMPWSDAVAVTVRHDQLLTISNGRQRLTVWAGLWPRHEQLRWVEAMRARNASVAFGRFAGSLDNERRAVVWCFEGQLLLPHLNRNAAGQLVETLPVDVVDTEVAALAKALGKRLGRRIGPLGRRSAPAGVAHLAALAGTDSESFLARARRVTIGGYGADWTVSVGDQPAQWRWQEALPPSAVAGLVLEAFGMAVEGDAQDEPLTGDDAG